ncbi:HAD family hydrolase [Tenacibaculum sp. IB213877]|uniref:HAD family hydrolase n=1 Tax=Tenacibaculum sp. IB213877 TaxID=3097351 RepID=UPI002A59AB89|nr:HAD hydrolase-like protein [Tenacibaculum sp. IB213877]MDY0780313.1 HAD hydrolase-like protein [Tenacibaculum sp. IB213877]
MKKQNLIVLDIDDTLTSSEEKHTDSFLFAMNEIGITNVDTDWRNYKNATDSYILKFNYEATFKKAFSLDIIPDFEQIMTEKFLEMPSSKEVKGASAIVNFFLKETDYALCFATGSLQKPAYLKLEQADINFIPEVLEVSNAIYAREDIVKSAVEKAKKYYRIQKFKNIISFGDGLWDAKTAKNLGVHFVGVNHKNVDDFKKQNVKYHINNWEEFELEKAEDIFNIN